MIERIVLEGTMSSAKNYRRILFTKKISPVLDKYDVQCVFMFRRAKIYPTSDKKFASFCSKCNLCNAAILREIDKEPLFEEDCIITFSINRGLEQYHVADAKRPLSGSRRLDLANT